MLLGNPLKEKMLLGKPLKEETSSQGGYVVR